MRRKQAVSCVLAAVLALVLLCGCQPVRVPAFLPAPALTQQDLSQAQALLDAQLGSLSKRVTKQEYGRCLDLMKRLLPLQQVRIEEGRYEKTDQETRLLEQLNQLYEDYTAQYLGEGGGWGYTNPQEQILAKYTIHPDGTVEQNKYYTPKEINGWDTQDYLALWDQICGILPEGAYRDFTRFTVFTDGEDETLAYVLPKDFRGERWEIAVDPADSQDGEYFTETVLHEYTHYLTLNSRQVTYTRQQTVDTYNEAGMVSHPGSYLDDFYQAFWRDYLDDRLVNLDSYNFYLRHRQDFVSEYASTDPSEDIAESFTFFVLLDQLDGEKVWQKKVDFFYQYPELVQFRGETREKLGLE